MYPHFFRKMWIPSLKQSLYISILRIIVDGKITFQFFTLNCGWDYTVVSSSLSIYMWLCDMYQFSKALTTYLHPCSCCLPLPICDQFSSPFLLLAILRHRVTVILLSPFGGPEAKRQCRHCCQRKPTYTVVVLLDWLSVLSRWSPSRCKFAFCWLSQYLVSVFISTLVFL